MHFRSFKKGFICHKSFKNLPTDKGLHLLGKQWYGSKNVRHIQNKYCGHLVVHKGSLNQATHQLTMVSLNSCYTLQHVYCLQHP